MYTVVVHSQRCGGLIINGRWIELSGFEPQPAGLFNVCYVVS